MTEGKHYGGFKYRNKRNQSHRGRNSFIGTVITAIAGTVVNDLTSEDSKIKKLFNKVIHPKQIENKENKNTIINAEYSVIDIEKTEREQLTNEQEKK
ncbi:MAG: hypothetical protein PF570_09800 [Candidatus Cloacimonetes bacterium]|jgi:hypothetical protein|nr:hypothetical protein [Candidatus Cloacimonadota bacterium]